MKILGNKKHKVAFQNHKKHFHLNIHISVEKKSTDNNSSFNYKQYQNKHL